MTILIRAFGYLIVTAFWMPVVAQRLQYSVANAHSHNDYEQRYPFRLAYKNGFGSIEADIHLVHGRLLVSHDSVNVSTKRSLKRLYLDPLAMHIRHNGGYVYRDSTRSLQLLIDIKTDSIATLETLIGLLTAFPVLTGNKGLQIVITGNRPPVELWAKYPAFIWFDGRPGLNYSPEAAAKVVMISDDLKRYTKWKGMGALPDSALARIVPVINEAHRLQKKVRFWACPDFASAWQALMDLQVDYINTDHIEELAAFLRRQESKGSSN